MSATQLHNIEHSHTSLKESELRILLDIVESTVRCYLDKLPLPQLVLSEFPQSLQQLGACFVTLHVNGQLQGCIGTTSESSPLVLEVQRKAWASACQDSRFAPLQKHQASGLEIEVSVLSTPIALEVTTEQELLDVLRHKHCGVILEDAYHHALFLPQVWEQLPTPSEFVTHLKLKGGWTQHYWSDNIQVKLFDVANKARAYQN
jgi:AmmeMemoRadiSam system protein A